MEPKSTDGNIPWYDKQVFHAFLFNIRNYSPEVIKLPRNIILPRVNNLDTKLKMAWNICFIICHKHQTRSEKIKAYKTQQISVKTQVFFCKNWTKTYLITTPSKAFNIIFVIFFWNHWLMKSSIRIRIFLIWNSQLNFFSVNCIRKKKKMLQRLIDREETKCSPVL